MTYFKLRDAALEGIDIMAEKKVNYTDEMVNRLHEIYDPESDEETREKQVAQAAEELERTPRSIRQKLVREGVYVAKAYKTKGGEKPARKEDIVNSIANTLGVDADTTLSGLEKATKNCLVFLQKTFATVAKDNETE